MQGMAKIFTSGYSKGGGFDQTPEPPLVYGYEMYTCECFLTV